MSLLGNAVLVNWGGIVKSKENDYNAWHSYEHMPERIGISGFLRGCRAIGIKGTDINHKYFMMYEANEKKVFESKEYIERLNNPTIWTKSILSNYISPSRTICDVLQSDSVGFGGFLATIRFLQDKIEKQINLEKVKINVKEVLELHGLTGSHLLLGDKKFGQLKTQEKKFRSNQGKDDQIISLAIVLEGLDFNFLKKGTKYLKNNLNLVEGDFLIINFYQCQHIITKTDLNFKL